MTDMTREEIEALVARVPEGFTPGPWVADQWDHIRAPNGQDVALVGRYADDEPEANANAALIALAPDLATALRALLALTASEPEGERQ